MIEWKDLIGEILLMLIFAGMALGVIIAERRKK